MKFDLTYFYKAETEMNITYNNDIVLPSSSQYKIKIK